GNPALSADDLLQCNVRCGIATYAGATGNEECRATGFAHTNCETKAEETDHCIM
ncbi:hypothetical protein AAVH_43648, partial [Aphelenchoides avenae]